MRWRVYYGDGSTASSEDVGPFSICPNNVQVVVAENNNGLSVMQGKDYFYWSDKMGWCPCDTGGLWDYLLIGTGPKYVLHGRSIRDEDYWNIVSRAASEGLG